MFGPPKGTPNGWEIWGNLKHLLAHSYISNPDHLPASPPSTQHLLASTVFRKIRQITKRVATAKAWGQYPPVVTPGGTPGARVPPRLAP